VIRRTIPGPKVLDASWKLPEVPYPEGVVQDQIRAPKPGNSRRIHTNSLVTS